MSAKRARSDDAAPAPELAATLETFRTQISDKSVALFNVRFVSKIGSLSETYESPLFQKDPHTIHAEKRAKKDGEEEASNAVLVEMIEIVKKELSEFCENASTIKVWIQLLTPAISDGNNFGVSVQEEVIQEFGRAEENAFNALDTISKYYLQRAKLITKRNKYPLVEDYRQCIRQTDEKVYITMRLSLMDLRNNYSLLHDMLQKNYPKVVNPRGSNASVAAMY